MEVIELKFLLKLLGKTNYQALVSEIKPNSSTSASERDKICRSLRDRELVACTEEFTKIKIAPPGKALLKLDDKNLPVTAQELKILKICEKGIISPGQTRVTPPTKRQESIDKLLERGLIEAAETKFKEVWLTGRGKEFLANEYAPSGRGNITITKSMVADYLQFLRKYLAASTTQQIPTHKLSDEEIFKAIIDLDRQLGTDNYLPIFHLRQGLQPPLSREELDRALYRLQENHKIELSTLADVSAYSLEEINTGIPQPVGGSLFFIIVS